MSQSYTPIQVGPKNDTLTSSNINRFSKLFTVIVAMRHILLTWIILFVRLVMPVLILFENIARDLWALHFNALAGGDPLRISP